MANDKPDNWNLCPRSDTLAPFDDAPATSFKHRTGPHSSDRYRGRRAHRHPGYPQYLGNVALKRGDQFLGTDSLTFDTDNETYIARACPLPGTARSACWRTRRRQPATIPTASPIPLPIAVARGNGIAESIDLQGSQGELHRSTYSTCDPEQRAWESARAPDRCGTATKASAWPAARCCTWAGCRCCTCPGSSSRSTTAASPALLYRHSAYSGRNGLDYRQPIYLNLAPNYDATCTRAT